MIRSRKLIGNWPSKCTLIKVEILKNSRRSQPLMKCSKTEKRERHMINMAKKASNKEVEAIHSQAAVVEFLSRCLVVAEDSKDHKKERMFNTH